MGERLDPSQMSERDRQMMGLGTQSETEESDDRGGYKPTKEAIERSAPSTPQKEATPKDRFANLEITPPGLSGKELEDWKAEKARQDIEAKEAARIKREEERYEEDHGPKSSF